MNSARADRVGERLLRRAQRLDNAFGLVLVLVVSSLVLGSLLPNQGWAAIVISVAVGAASIAALTGSHARQALVRSALWLSLAAIALAFIAAVSGGRFWLNACALIQVVLLTGAMLAVLYRVLTSTEIGTRTILGAISVYALLGILFAYIYGAVDLIQGGPFFTEVAHPGGSDFLFFSYSTLTTTGFGNLVPGGQPGRMFAGLEMMAGQIVLVTLIAGLIRLWRPGEAMRRRLAGRTQG
jgi:Ion channel.